MKRCSIYMFITCSVVFLLFSCTVEKRSYMKGYHVEWNKRIGTDSQMAHHHHSSTIEKKKTEASLLPMSEVRLAHRPALRSTLCADSSSNQSDHVSLREATCDKKNANVLNANFHGKNDVSQSAFSAQVNPKAKVSFAFGVLSMISLVLLFAFNTTSLPLAIILLVGVLLFAVLAIRIGNAFSEQYNNARHMNNGSGLATTGRMLGWLSITILVGFLILISGILLVFNVILAAV